ncbi:LodA/GoxA family CTQ-dependent oxidase [Tundrisphaera sp. TA3]|uniref:LodA/GoxA family CTQ-dependent oxidase n=1 Tax=Tundrisphaera sp. TA3 TaxID=3435775 RepID=UPI003EB6AAD3
MFVRMTQEKRIALGQSPAERSVFRKLHGVASGRFEVSPSLDPRLRLGIFAHDSLEAWMRFSSDTAPASADLGSTLGIGIKLFGVADSDGLGEPRGTADLIMQNFPRFFVQDARAMCEFTYAGVVLRDYEGYLAKHPDTREVLDAMAKVEGSVLTATYWAILPFRLGDEIVKYRLEPEAAPQDVPDDSDDYLAVDMANRLARGEYRFRFMIQRRTDPGSMPLDRAMDEWSEDESPFVHAATLILPAQDIRARGQSEYGQRLAFNIWRTPRANAPSEQSSIAAVRKAVYAAGAAARHLANGESPQDSSEPRPVAAREESPDACIVKAVIYPPIGIARVGNSPEEYFIGPEVPDPPAKEPGSYRDQEGRLKRQGARFRVYGVDAGGRIVRELSARGSGASVRWSVRLANTKAAWYTFQLALDIPEASMAVPTTLRNAGVADRSQLAITPSGRSVEGPDAGPERFDDGSFMGSPVDLGEIRTDDEGRLIVLGGHGVSRSHDGSLAITFANNEGWHDDVSDGPVTAEVTVDGRKLAAVPAWVVVAPPDYGPRRKSVRTMWDLMRDVAIKAGTLAAPARPSYSADILPLFRRLAGLQWVNAGFAAGFGWKGLIDFTDEGFLARLGDNGPAGRELRRVVSNAFRRFDVDSWSPAPWPWIYGDAMNIPPAHTPRQYAALTDTQLTMLDQWAAGDFVADYDPDRQPPGSIDEVPLAVQGEVLTRAALEFCLADAFHPGCEMTWPVRSSTMYMEPFRWAHQAEGWIEPGLGEILTPDAVTIPNGPLYGQAPGGITRWMAVPWQTDTASCRSGYDKAYDPYVPSFWPARVPNQVLTKENYAIVMDTDRPLDERLAAFANRATWLAPLGSGTYTQQINNMIRGFGQLGVVEAMPGPGGPEFPAEFEVEDQHPAIKPGPADAARARKAPAASGSAAGVVVGEDRGESAADVDLSRIDKLHRFPGIGR